MFRSLFAVYEMKRDLKEKQGLLTLEKSVRHLKESLPPVNIHPNSLLTCKGADENGLYIPDVYSYNSSLIETAELIPVRKLVDSDSDRHPIEAELLDWVFGSHQNYLIEKDFNILHIRTKPKPKGAKWFLWKGIHAVPRCTYRAYVKVVSGTLFITCAGVFTSSDKWQLMESQTGSNRVIWDEHRLDETADGEALEYYFAFPQVLLGHVSFPKGVLAVRALQPQW